MSLYTHGLNEGLLSVSEVGGKAHWLSYLLSHGIRVPDGFAVTTSAYRNFLLVNNLNAPLAEDDILNGAIPPALEAEIRDSLHHLNAIPRLAVRSSSVFEDMADASFAGQYDTILDVGAGDVLQAIKRCWASGSRIHAHEYAKEHGLHLDQANMGVVVQALVPADVAGVSFSTHPITGADSVVINASYGLGESVVAGLVVPDEYTIDKKTQEVGSTMGFKETLIRSKAEGGTELVDTPSSQVNQFCLSDHEVQEIFRLTVELENLVKHPVDVEWAIFNGVIYCLQMRPITITKGAKS